MQYMLLIYGAEDSGPEPGTAEFGTYMQGYEDFTNKVMEDGKFVSGEALQPVNEAITLCVRKDKTQTIDGPFIETKEQLGGYYLLNCENIEEALSYAAMIPDAQTGHIEIRPAMVFD